jgi:hypothetical protein
MSQPHDQLSTLFSDAFRQLERHRPVPEIEIKFYPYAGSHHTIRLRSGRVYVRISDIFKDAPANIHRALAFILVAKLLGKSVPDVHQRVYRDYACSPKVLRASDLARRRRGRKEVSSARGRFYDLDKIFERLNRRYFGGRLEKPTLTWSQRRTRHIHSHYSPIHRGLEPAAIVVNRALDEHDVPDWLVEYILFHEMLHIKHPPRLINGRRYRHTKAFHAEEQRFPYYEEAQDWIYHFAEQRRVPRAA